MHSKEHRNTEVWKSSIEAKRLQDVPNELEADADTKDSEQGSGDTLFPVPTLLPHSSKPHGSSESSPVVALSYSALSLTPISALVQVNVSLPSHVWCGVLTPGKQFTPEDIKASRTSVLVQSICFYIKFTLDSSIIVIKALRPSTLYNLYCYGESDYGAMAESVLASMKRINTPPTIFQIKNEKLWNSMLSFVLESNVRLDATCVLFDDQCNNKKL